MLTSATDKHVHFYESLKQGCYFATKTTCSLVNKDQTMLHKLSLDANSMAISYWQGQEYAYMNIFSFDE